MRLVLLAAVTLALAGCSAAPDEKARFVLIEDKLIVESDETVEAYLGPHCTNVTYELDPPSLVYRTADRSVRNAPDLMIVRRYTVEGEVATFSADRTELYVDMPFVQLLSPVDRLLSLAEVYIDDTNVDLAGYAAGTAGATIQRDYEVGNASIRETITARDMRTVPVRVEHTGGCD